MSPAARVVGFADSGVFEDHQKFGSTDAPYTDQMQNIWKIGNPATNAACSAAADDGQGWKCYMAQYIEPFVKTPIFDADAMYDAWMIPNILQLGCDWRRGPEPGSCSAAQVKAFEDWGQHANTTIATALLRPGLERGGFITACIHHCQSMYMCGGEGSHRWTALTIRGTNLRDAFGNFFFRRAGPKLLLDEVAYPHNPSCPTWGC